MRAAAWRVLGAIALIAFAILSGTLFALSRVAARDPGVRIQRELSSRVAPVDVRVRSAPDDDGDGSRVFVSFPRPATAGESEEVARLVWQRFDGRVGSVVVAASGTADRTLGADHLLATFGPRPVGLSESGFRTIGDRVRLVALLAVAAVALVGVLVVCAAVAAVSVARGRVARRAISGRSDLGPSDLGPVGSDPADPPP